MKIILSPAKTMIDNTDFFTGIQQPLFIDKAEHLKQYLQQLTKEELKDLLKANDQIVDLNYQRLHRQQNNNHMAIMSYQGIAYQHLAPSLLTSEELDYLEKHLCILSAMYGILKPFDAISHYRLEMASLTKQPGFKNLYEYWQNEFNDFFNDQLVINLASNEYSKLVKSKNLINIHFVVLVDGKYKTKATLAKMARGSMVRFMAINNITQPSQLKEFNELGFSYSLELSDENNYYFIKSKGCNYE